MSTPQITTYGVDMDDLVLRAITIMLKKLEDKSYTTGRVLITGSMIERDSVRIIEKADEPPAE